MHEGRLTKEQLRQWVINRYYYQTRIPIKDALIVAKSEDPAFRRMWIHRVQDHDGTDESEGGIALWWQLADAVGVDRSELISCQRVLPGVRFACDAYVNFVRDASLLEAVASSLTEFFVPGILQQRIAAWEKHYPWVRQEGLSYFRSRVSRAQRDSTQAIRFVTTNAHSAELQDLCVAALIRKTDILWCLLDAIHLKYVWNAEP